MTNVIVAAKTDVGRVRTNNEDAYSLVDLDRAARLEASPAEFRLEVGQSGLLLALSDGMGGHQAGEVASALVLESLCGALLMETDEPVAGRIDAAVRKANADVFQAALDAHKKGMGATLTALFIRGGEAHLAQVGDSRLYLVRGDQIRQLSRDQSLVQLLVDGGVLSPEQAKHSPRKNVILQAMGLEQEVKVAVARLQLRRDDVVLLCCDGLSNALSDGELLGILLDNTPARACERLIALANERGGEDNLTAIVARIGGGALKAPDSIESFESTFEALQHMAGPAAKAPPTAKPAESEPVSEASSPAPAQPSSTLTTPAHSSGPGSMWAVAIGCAVALAALLWWMRG